jgi:DNA-binding GntR family transcriptional regulator
MVETQIAHEFGTSQAPVRESLRDLESLRFVESQAFRGTRVRAITQEELAEIYPVRAAIEEVAAQMAALHLDGGLGDLKRELEAMRRAADLGDLHDQVHHDVDFHRLIVHASQNTTLIEVWSSLRIEARTLITSVQTHLDLHQIAEMHLPFSKRSKLEIRSWPDEQSVPMSSLLEKSC